MTLNKNIQSVLPVIIVSIMISGLLLALLFGSRDGFPETIDIQLYDTYYVLDPLLLFIHLSLSLAFIISWFMPVFLKHTHHHLNIIKLITSGILLVSFILLLRNMLMVNRTLVNGVINNNNNATVWTGLPKLTLIMILVLATSIAVTVFSMMRNRKSKLGV